MTFFAVVFWTKFHHPSWRMILKSNSITIWTESFINSKHCWKMNSVRDAVTELHAPVAPYQKHSYHEQHASYRAPPSIYHSLPSSHQVPHTASLVYVFNQSLNMLATTNILTVTFKLFKNQLDFFNFPCHGVYSKSSKKFCFFNPLFSLLADT